MIKYPYSNQTDKASLNMTNIDEAGKQFCQYQHKFCEHMENRFSRGDGWLNRLELRVKLSKEDVCKSDGLEKAMKQAFIDLWSMQTRYVVNIKVLK